MSSLLLVLLLTVAGLLQTDSFLLEGSAYKELNIYKARVRVLYDFLAKECYPHLRTKRQIQGYYPDQLLIEKELYRQLFKELIECRQKNSGKVTSTPKQVSFTTTGQIVPSTTEHIVPTTTEQIVPSTTEHIVPTTTEQIVPSTTKQVVPSTTEHIFPTTKEQIVPTTTKQVVPTTTERTTTTPMELTTPTRTATAALVTAAPQPIECQQATNYAEWWRRDYNGSHIRPGGSNSYDGYACDLHVSNSWFRFTGEAGSRMLNKCPKWKSCGALLPYWTDAEMPTVVGVESTVDGYAMDGSHCRTHKTRIRVMRCSRDTEHDFVYKQTAINRVACGSAFCGMF